MTQSNFVNPGDGLLSTVSIREDGRLAVSLRDTDAGETLPTIKIFDDLEPAVREAMSLSLMHPDAIDFSIGWHLEKVREDLK